MSAEEMLAIHGGPKTRTQPFPRRTPFGEEEVAMVTEAVRSQNLFIWSGRFVHEFEEKFAAFYGVPHAVASTSGTAAIHAAVGAVNPNPGDEIITAPITDLGTVIPILLQNAVPIFADIDDTFNIDPEDVERKITPRTRAIIAVHLFGNACNMDALLDIARRRDLVLIEDCSQAHATQYKGRWLGTIGDIGCFSLQQSKHMTTGDGGMTITSNDALAERMHLFVDKGYRRKGYGPRAYAFLAPCYRMNEQTAAVGIPQLKRVRDRGVRRMHLGRRLAERLADIDGIRCAPTTPGSEHSFWLFPIVVEGWSAAEFAKAVSAEGVPAGAGYIGKPIFQCAECCSNHVTYGDSAFPFASPYVDRDLRYDETTCPRASQGLGQLVTLHLHEQYSDADVDDMAAAVRKVARLLPRTA